MIDFRSDTVTKPDQAMRDAMMNAEVGDDVYGEDPTVKELEQYAADLIGTQAAIFAPTGTQTNLLAMMSHCHRGDEYIVGQQAHTYRYEAGGAAVLASIQPQPIENQADGSLRLTDIIRNIKEDDIHFAKTVLLCQENTVAGQALPIAYLQDSSKLAKQHHLAHHLDGARVFNAAISQQVDIKQISTHFDSVSVCLSKGLGAPVGSVLCGSEALINRARRHRKMLGGGMRQAGFLAAAGLYALINNVERLAQDHHHAAELAHGLSSIDEINVIYSDSQTNMVFIEMTDQDDAFIDAMKKEGILVTGRYKLRLVTHKDLSIEDIHYSIEKIKAYFSKK